MSSVAAVRAFSRFYTRVVGVLADGLLGTTYSVTEARVIFELAHRDTTDVSWLRAELDIDAGYLSRIAGRFEADGLAVRERSAQDGRRQQLRLTDRGREVFADLENRANAQVAALLRDIGPADRDRLVTAMDTVRSVLGERPKSRVVLLRPPVAGEYGWIVARHGAYYAAEYGWDSSFEALVARIVADHLDRQDPARDAAWIAEVDGEPAGCVLCVREDEHTARLRLLLVEPSARGLGIGSRLVEECLRFATAAGYRRITLWTNNVLTAARTIYRAAGFELVDEQPHHSYGKDLVGETWSRDLCWAPRPGGWSGTRPARSC